MHIHAEQRGFQGKVDYGHLRMVFETLFLPPGVNALEEIGIPVQTLARISSFLEFPEAAGVDELVDHLRANYKFLKSTLGEVDQSFVRRALGSADSASTSD